MSLHLTLTGAVIRRFQVDDSRVLWLFTKERGLITAFANGALRAKKGMAAGTDLFSYGEFEIFYYKDKYSVNAVSIKKSFLKLTRDLKVFGLASYIVELTAVIAPKEMPDEEMLRLYLNVLHFLDKGTKDLYQLKAIFELRGLSLAGFMPDLVSCGGCGCFETEKGFYFSLGEGRIFCEECAGEEKEQLIFLPPAVLAAMRHIIYSEMENLFSFRLTEELAQFLAYITGEYTLYHTEKKFNSLSFLKEIGMNP